MTKRFALMRFVCFILSFVIGYLRHKVSYETGGYLWAALMCIWAYFIIAAAKPNYRPLWIATFIGGSLNVLAVLANGGRMPVLGLGHIDDVDHFSTTQPRLQLLCDHAVLAGFSIGDCVIIAASFAMLGLWIGTFMRERKYSKLCPQP